MTIATASPHPTANSLRRAKYVNVEELVLSQYVIDRKSLDDELAKLRAPSEATNAACGDPGKEPGSPNEVTGSTKVQYNSLETPNQNDLQAGSHRSPFHAKHHLSRLQPPRDGFNLCL